jgi:hypothetical protein
MLFKTHLCNHILLQSGGGTWGTVLYTVSGEVTHICEEEGVVLIMVLMMI